MDNPVQQTTQKKIFFVDDDKFLLDMYALKFNKAGFDVKTSDSTEAAFKMIKDGYIPDILLSDIVMPGMDGLELVATIRKEKLLPKAVVIMLTNQGSEQDIYNVKRFNIDGYIIKATTMPSEVVDEVLRITKAHHKS